jgi:hypothetical protein
VSASVITACSTAAASFLMAAAVRMLSKIHKDFRQFMREHLWLLAQATWSRESIVTIMKELDIAGPLPPEWPKDRT